MPSRTTTVYIPEIKQKFSLRIQEVDWNTWQEFLQVAKREGQSPGSILYKEMIQYVRLHSAGNPQQRLDTIAKTGQAYRAPLLCACGRKATRKNTLNNGETVYSCSLHAPAKERVRMWKPIK